MPIESAFTRVSVTMKYTGKSINDLQTLSSILGSKPAELRYLSLNMEKNVRTYNIPKKHTPTEKRAITAPSEKLKRIQREIKDHLLDNYTLQPYVYGLGGNTLRDHANLHKGTKVLVQLDIRDFYPSISHALVFKMWVEKFGFSADVARVLTKLTTMNGGLVQGFPTSSHIAAIVAEDLTAALDKHCRNNSMSFSQYVDDFNISGNNINYRDVFKLVVTTGREYGLSIKRKKTRVNSKHVGKKITGVALTNQSTRATREVRQRAIRALKDLASQPEDEYFQKRVAGYASFLKHLKSRDGKKYKKQVNNIRS